LITIVVADDHQIVRQGVKALLEREADFRVVGEAVDGPETVRLVQRLTPTVLVLDLAMGGLDGLDVLLEAQRLSPETRVVVLSMHSDEAYAREALNRGALAYVLKSAGSAEILRAVRRAIKRERHVSPPLSQRAIDAYPVGAGGTPVDAYELLTIREREVLHLAAEGHSNAEIGARLFISPRTVEIHRAKAMHKLGLRNYGGLVRYALRRGWIPAG
jgi:DNA-binding NarL/FixJ family response regulator